MIVIHKSEAIVKVPVWLQWRHWHDRERLHPAHRAIVEEFEAFMERLIIWGKV